MRKPAFSICENKDADQLCGDRTADQRLCFRHIDIIIPLLPKPLAIFCGDIAQFVSDLVEKKHRQIFSRCSSKGLALSQKNRYGKNLMIIGR